VGAYRVVRCLDNQLTDGGKVVSPMHQPRFTPQKHYYFSAPGTRFCYRLSKLQGLARLEGLGKVKNSMTSLGLQPATFRLVAYYAAACPKVLNVLSINILIFYLK
jgi:hypothetical protein